MGSSRKDRVKILGIVPPARAEDFLQWFANLGDDDADQLFSKYPEMFHPSTTPEQVMAYGRKLRLAWKSPDERIRDWYIFSLRHAHALGERSLHAPHEVAAEVLSTPRAQQTLWKEKDYDWLSAPPPHVTPFEAVLYYFQTRVGDLAKYCGHVDCPAPYFIAKKRAQKFCSEECAGPANRESKRKWWSENRGKAAR